MDDIWQHVIAKLSVKDRFHCELVSKEWNQRSVKVWRRAKSIDTDILCNDINSSHWSKCIELSLDRCGNNISSFRFGFSSNIAQESNIKVKIEPDVIVKLFKKSVFLRKIEFRCVFLPSNFYELLNRIPSSLRIFRIISCIIDADDPQCIRDALIRLLQKCTQLKELTITGRGFCYGYLVIDTDLLSKLPRCIEKIFIGAGKALKLHDLAFSANLTQLLELDIERSEVDEEALETLVTNCRHLTYLNVSFSRNIKNFMPIAALSYLRQLHVNGNREYFNDDQLIEIIDGCKMLEELSINTCVKITEFGVKSIGNCERLKSLSVNGLLSVTDESLEPITRRCIQIEKLEISFCRKVTKLGLELLSRLQHLASLDVTGNLAYDSEMAQNIHESLPKCITVAHHCAHNYESQKLRRNRIRKFE